MSKDVFLSHSSDDDEVAKKVRAALERWGVKVWIAPDDISGGRRWGEAIVDGIQSCDGVVFLSSEQSHASEQTEKEIGIADELNKPIVPVRLDETDLPNQFRYHLAHLQWIDINTPPTERDYERIARAIEGRCSDVSITPPKEINEREEKIADEIANVLRRNVDANVLNFDMRSQEFVAEIRESITEQRNSYVIELHDDDTTLKKYVESTQSDAMSAATNHLIENYDLVEELGGVPWVPGKNKAILNDTDEWDQSSHKFRELDSGYYLNMKIDREAKKSCVRDMCEICGFSVRFHGKW